MPTYEYRCRDCGEELEISQSFDDDPLTVCPRCQGALKKVFGSIGISFKGDGFYKTDSRTAATAGTKAGAEASDGSASDGSAAGAPSKTDAATKESSPAKDSSSSGGGSSDGGSSDGGSSDGGSSGGGSSDGGSGGGSKSTATADSST